MMTRSHLTRSASAIVLALCIAAPVGAKEIGTTAAVNPATYGTPPDAGRRTLLLGADVVFKEAVETEGRGQTQILFLDESTLTIGPNSKIVLDEFVYDPAAADGTLSISMAQGVLRYVGGKISKTGGVSIETPSAIIGVRGGISVVKHDPGTGDTSVLAPFGIITIKTPGSDPGGSGEGEDDDGTTADSTVLVTVGSDGSVESTEVDPDDVASLFSNFQGGTGDGLGNEEVEEGFNENPPPSNDPSADPGSYTPNHNIGTNTIGGIDLNIDPGEVNQNNNAAGPPEVAPPPPPPNMAPDAMNDLYNTLQDTVLIVPMGATDLNANDLDEAGMPPVTAFDAVSAFGGAVVANADGSFTYTPPAGFFGTDTFEYTVTDAGELMDTATASIVVSGIIGGRVMLTTDPFTTDDGGLVTDPFLQNFIGGPDLDSNTGFSDAIYNPASGVLALPIVGVALPAPCENAAGAACLFPTLAFGTEFEFDVIAVPGEGPFEATGYVSNFDFDFYYFDATNSTAGFEDTAFIFGGNPTDLSNPALANGTVRTYDLRPDPNLSPSVIPFVSQFAGGNFTNPSVSPYYLVEPTSGGFDTTTPIGVEEFLFNGAQTLQASFAIQGQWAAQKSILVGVAGGLFESEDDEGAIVITEGTRGTARYDATEDTTRFTAQIGSVPDENDDHFFGPDLDYFVLHNNDPWGVNSNPSDIFTSGNFEITHSGIGTVNGYRHVASATDTAFVPGMRVDHTSESNPLRGYFAVLGQSVEFPEGPVFSDPYPVMTENDLPFGAEQGLFMATDTTTNSLFARFNFDTDAIPDGPVTDITDGRFTFGGIGGTRGTYIDEQHFGARNVGGPSAPQGDINGEPGESFTFNPDGFRSLMVAHDVVGEPTFKPGVDYCECDYLKWGYWTSEFIWDDSQSEVFRTERFHLGTFAAGELPTQGDINDLRTAGAVANFDGHMIGNVWDNTGEVAEQYIEAANFDAFWNFGSQDGTFAVDDFDGAAFSGSINAKGDIAVSPLGAHFSGSDTAMRGSTEVQIDIDGSFFQGATTAADHIGGHGVIYDTGTGGEVPIPGEEYRATVTFAADGDVTIPQ
ncbi:MAG: hypothetical protein GY791_06400 [Alphaproteobacteria bacterium]|nr:hypothetical protein [Alphaproteobacteria bacterium]